MKIKFLILAGALGLTGYQALAQNIVQNGSFQTGTLADWVLMPAATGTDQQVTGGRPPFLGYVGDEWQAGATGGLDDYISQALATTVGKTYQISYWIETDTGDNNQTGYYNFTSSFGGTTLQNLNPPPITAGNTFAPTEFSYDVVATAPSTTLSFGIQALHGWYYLSDISVVQTNGAGVPDGGTTVSLLGLGFLGLGALRRKLA
jgi:hypothetical protein